MARIDIRKASKGESRSFGKGHAEIQDFGGHAVAGRYTFEPGWRWSTHMSEKVGTPSCQATHFGYCLSGRMTIRMDDGESADVSAGDFLTISPGHDAWVVGDEPCVVLDFAGAEHYARRGVGRQEHAEAASSAHA